MFSKRTAFIAIILCIIFCLGTLFGAVLANSMTKNKKPILCKVETTGVGAENRIFARTEDGEVYSWYQDEGEASAFYVIALNGNRVVNALPLK